ncbi:MAG: hypothetical protein HGB03_02570 [Candidatus Yonathbacteria bacterium]|nr:hypothetical protein [Candidatus Yonathbacteria bacterium]NTW47475.1 hypothetical protein [Candidatus Yonathbacteria bacterium]
MEHQQMKHSAEALPLPSFLSALYINIAVSICVLCIVVIVFTTPSIPYRQGIEISILCLWILVNLLSLEAGYGWEYTYRSFRDAEEQLSAGEVRTSYFILLYGRILSFPLWGALEYKKMVTKPKEEGTTTTLLSMREVYDILSKSPDDIFRFRFNQWERRTPDNEDCFMKHDSFSLKVIHMASALNEQTVSRIILLDEETGKRRVLKTKHLAFLFLVTEEKPLGIKEYDEENAHQHEILSNTWFRWAEEKGYIEKA